MLTIQYQYRLFIYLYRYYCFESTAYEMLIDSYENVRVLPTITDVAADVDNGRKTYRSL